jgi:hypothetical protein
MNKNKLTMTSDDESNTFCYMDNKGEVIKIVHENFPLYAVKTVNISNEEIAIVPVKSAICVGGNNTENYYFNSSGVNKSVVAMDGIIYGEELVPVVLMHVNKGEGLEKGNVKSGAKIGTISTIIELEQDDKGDNKEEDWDLETLKEKIKLTDSMSTAEKKKNI